MTAYVPRELRMLRRIRIIEVMNKLGTSERVRIVSALIEGCSIRATCRMTGVAKRTVLKLLVDIGTACKRYHDEYVTGLRSKRIQCDEIWSFIGCKDKNVYDDEAGFGRGSAWTWTALDADSKLVISYLVGLRDGGYAYEFMQDVAKRLTHRVQLTTDGHKAYLNAVEDAFGCDIDYAMLVKLYGAAQPGEARYSPPKCIGTVVGTVTGNPDEKHISTSYVERQNLTMRMHMRRFTRLTNAFSKKAENHAHSVALHFMHYNFLRVHQTLRVTPAMEAGLTDHIWTIEELLALIPESTVAAWGTRNGRRVASESLDSANSK
jgi:IS1 family transposase